MNFKSLLAGCLLLMAAAMPVAALESQYTTVLKGSTEIPASGSPGVGLATITVDFGLLAMHVQASFSGLLGTTTASHIHCCTATPGSANVGVATQLPTFAGFPLGVTAGTYDHLFDMSLASSYNPAFVTANGSVSAAFSALVAGMETGNAYFNIHTTAFPGGEIRGLLQPVPEPATYAMFGVGLSVLAWRARHRRRG